MDLKPRRILLSLSLLPLTLPTHRAVLGAEISPRVPLTGGGLLFNPEADQRLIVKFRDDVRARANEEGKLESLTAMDLSAAKEIASRFGVTFSRLIQLAEETVSFLEARASEQALPTADPGRNAKPLD